MRKIQLLLLALLAMGVIQAEIKLPAIFSDNMMMQRESAAKVWGKATPNMKVAMITSWSLKTYSAVADSEGNWNISYYTPKAGGSHHIVLKEGKQIITLNNIACGDIWFCSGQSNMEMPMKGFKNQPVKDANMDILKSINSNIRLFTVKRASSLSPMDDVNGRWEEAMPVSVRDFSATAYYFGKTLNEVLNVPIGLVCSAWGGSSIESWMSKDMLEAFPEAKVPESLEGLKDHNRVPGALYPAMIQPLAGLAIKGFIWYQGETNCERANTYAKMFKGMVEGWRAKWNQQDTIPFYYCQIAPFDYNQWGDKGINSAYLREAQMKAESTIAKSGMAVLMDLGMQTGIHPDRKREGGERLALLALNKTYNLSGFEAESPVYKDIDIQNDTVIVSFDRAPMWVTAPELKSLNFKLAGDDKVFHPAKAWISHSKIYVKSEEVAHPVAVRYAFDDFVVGDLFGTGGLPVSSFRSDNW